MKDWWNCDGCGERVTREGNVRARELRATVEELARALLAVEWAGAVGFEGEYHACPSCRGVWPEEEWMTERAQQRWSKGHKPDCALDLALRKAGVR